MSPPRLPDLVSLNLLVTVAETGSLRRAGERLGISQPAASVRIRELERHLSLTLLERSASGSRLTAAGATVVDWARPVLDRAGELIAAAEALSASTAKRLRVAASLTIAEYLMPGWLVVLRANEPQMAVALQVANSERVAELVRGRHAELGFVEGWRPPTGLRSQTVAADELVVVVGTDHPWARRRRPVSTAELAGTALVSREPGSGTREVLEHLLTGRTRVVAPVAELASTTAIKAAVQAGQGPAVLSRLAVGAELAAGLLCVVPFNEVALRRRLRAVWLPEQPPHGPAADLLASVLEESRVRSGAR
jgi:DNA-binding transcriptional LysR family regulator